MLPLMRYVTGQGREELLIDYRTTFFGIRSPALQPGSDRFYSLVLLLSGLSADEEFEEPLEPDDDPLVPAASSDTGAPLPAGFAAPPSGFAGASVFMSFDCGAFESAGFSWLSEAVAETASNAAAIAAV